ncbi:MAG: type III-B CRISPR module RAMP protein Cmr4 [Thermodesulfovibrio sp.]|nr:type III-B CRISPR module RAMP protein Cmr4 [Thermodesulfovibrio sp.]MDW7998072.1 type III-B CRISPR module RAMP protein Cmr4 [Thermodesulfovibrio sp.]
MFKEKRIMFLIAETPVHAGSGSEVGIVDLPIQRERYTEYPKIESSGLKGCLREAFENSLKEIEINNQKVRANDKKAISIVFGPEGEEAHAGAITITDARILLFPVKSLKGVFAWITCPMVLERFKRDLEIAGVGNFESSNFFSLQNTIPSSSNIAISSKVVLEEFTFEVKENEITQKLASWFAKEIFPNNSSYQFWKEKLEKDLVILSDDDFKHFVKSSTEIITRIRIDDVTGTAKGGALWTEEYLPQDTIMYSIVMFTQPRVEKDEQKGIFRAEVPEEAAKLVSKFFERALPEIIQIGGNQTIGKGFMRVKLFGKSETGG